jgi:hypothetical protein
MAINRRFALLLTVAAIGGSSCSRMSSGETSIAPPPAKESGNIVATVYDYYAPNRPLSPSYGRYTYLILSVNEDHRNTIFLKALFQSVRPAHALKINPKLLNLLAMPVKQSFVRAQTAGLADLQHSGGVSTFLAKYYDYDKALELIATVCSNATQKPGFCGSAFNHGPYLLTFATRVAQNSAPSPILSADCSPFAERAFPTVIDTLLQQMRDPSLDERSRLESTRLRLLAMTIDASDWLPSALHALSGYVRLFSLHSSS